MGTLKPNKSIVYEKDNRGQIWARYHNETDRWLVGGPSLTHIEFEEWRNLIKTAQQNTTLRLLLEKTINTYNLIKNEK